LSTSVRALEATAGQRWQRSASNASTIWPVSGLVKNANIAVAHRAAAHRDLERALADRPAGKRRQLFRAV